MGCGCNKNKNKGMKPKRFNIPTNSNANSGPPVKDNERIRLSRRLSKHNEYSKIINLDVQNKERLLERETNINNSIFNKNKANRLREQLTRNKNK